MGDAFAGTTVHVTSIDPTGRTITLATIGTAAVIAAARGDHVVVPSGDDRWCEAILSLADAQRLRDELDRAIRALTATAELR